MINYYRIGLALSEMLDIGYSRQWINYLFDTFGLPKGYKRPEEITGKYMYCKEIVMGIHDDPNLQHIITDIALYIIDSKRFHRRYFAEALNHLPIFEKVVVSSGLKINQDKFRVAYISIPEELIVPIQKYLLFFKEYVKIAKNKSIEFEIFQMSGGLQIKVGKKEELNLINLQIWFKEYFAFMEGNLDDIIINVEGEISSKKVDLLRLKLENQVSHLKSDLRIVEFQNHQLLKESKKTLKKHNKFLQKLVLSFNNKDMLVYNQYFQDGNQQFANEIENKKSQLMKIENLNIHGGNQQFADKIINSSSHFDETDKKLIQLIHDNVTTPEERNELLKSLEDVKSPEKSEEEKKKSGSILRKFFDSIATESGKQVVQDLVENGAEYVQYIF